MLSYTPLLKPFRVYLLKSFNSTSFCLAKTIILKVVLIAGF
jgi:hypothetical protein